MPGTGGWFDPDDITAFLDSWARLPRFAGLCSSDPKLASDPLTVEVLGDAYRRTPAAWLRSGMLLRNSTPWQFMGLLPGTRVHGIAIWDASFNGKVKAYIPLDEPVDLPTGGNFTAAAGDYFIGFDS